MPRTKQTGGGLARMAPSAACRALSLPRSATPATGLAEAMPRLSRARVSRAGSPHRAEGSAPRAASMRARLKTRAGRSGVALRCRAPRFFCRDRKKPPPALRRRVSRPSQGCSPAASRRAPGSGSCLDRDGLRAAVPFCSFRSPPRQPGEGGRAGIRGAAQSGDAASTSLVSTRRVSFWVISRALCPPLRKDQSQLIATASRLRVPIRK